MARKEAAKTAKKKLAITDEQFHAVSRAVADPRRFAILQQVAAAEAPEGLPCGALQEHNVISPATISHHMKELADAGLVNVEREGRCSNIVLQREIWDAYLQRLSSL